MIAGLALAAALGGIQPSGPANGPGARTQQERHAPSPGPLGVPFLPQGPLLCGGAAAAMVERYWGARGVYAEDYQPLVREHEGGIRTTDLAEALRVRGYDVRFVGGTGVAGRLEREGVDVPLILLLRSGQVRFHYVVLVALDGDRALVHDPMLGPRRALSLGELRRRWSASGFWALEARPGASARGAPAGPAADAARDPAEERHSSSRTAPVGARAPPDGTGARQPAHPLAAEAVRALRSGRHDEARRHATRLATESPGDSAISRRVWAAASYLEGEPDLALDHWNRLGEPRLDLLVIDGLDLTRHPLVWDHLGLRTDSLLTAEALHRARERLSQVPAVISARLEYRPLADGSAEVRAAVVERPRLPGRTWLLQAGADALVDREAAVTVGPLLGSGDRWSVGGRWHPADAAVGGRVAVLMPPLPGVVHVSSAWRRQRFASEDAGHVTEEARVGVTVGLEHWWSGAWRVAGHAGTERWAERGRFAVAELSALRRLGGGAAWAAARGQTWIGPSGAHGRVALKAEAELPHGADRSWLLRADAAMTTWDAPRSLWNGAGTGELREPLLRGHPLLTERAIGGPAFGRGLTVASVQQVSWRMIGPVRGGVGIFVDAAWAWHRARGSPATGFLDPGVEALLEAGHWRAAVAVAARRGGAVLSARLGSVTSPGWTGSVPWE